MTALLTDPDEGSAGLPHQPADLLSMFRSLLRAAAMDLPACKCSYETMAEEICIRGGQSDTWELDKQHQEPPVDIMKPVSSYSSTHSLMQTFEGHHVRISDMTLEYDWDEIAKATGSFSSTRKLGRGRFSAVFQGRLEEGVDVAVKVLDTFTPDQHIAFEDEVTLLSRIRHPNVVMMLGCGIDPGGLRKALVYELLPNGSCYHRLHESPEPFAWQDRLKTCLELSRGLAHLHRYRPEVFHRDIKPAKVLYSRQGVAKLVDFGLACASRERFERHSWVRVPTGTVGYAAPEYAERSEATEACEVYSAGIVLLELLTGRLPAEPVADATDDWIFLLDELRPDSPHVADRVLKQLDARASWPLPIARKLTDLTVLCVQGEAARRPNFMRMVITLKGLWDFTEEGLRTKGETADKDEGRSEKKSKKEKNKKRKDKDPVESTQVSEASVATAPPPEVFTPALRSASSGDEPSGGSERPRRGADAAPMPRPEAVVVGSAPAASSYSRTVAMPPVDASATLLATLPLSGGATGSCALVRSPSPAAEAAARPASPVPQPPSTSTLALVAGVGFSSEEAAHGIAGAAAQTQDAFSIPQSESDNSELEAGVEAALAAFVAGASPEQPRGWWQQPQRWVRSGLARIQGQEPGDAPEPSRPSREPRPRVAKDKDDELCSEGAFGDLEDEECEAPAEAGPRTWLVGGLQVAGQGLQTLKKTSTGLLARAQGAVPGDAAVASPMMGGTSSEGETGNLPPGWLGPIRGLIDKAKAGREGIHVPVVPPLPLLTGLGGVAGSAAAGLGEAELAKPPSALADEPRVPLEPFEPDLEACSRLRHISDVAPDDD